MYRDLNARPQRAEALRLVSFLRHPNTDELSAATRSRRGPGKGMSPRRGGCCGYSCCCRPSDTPIPFHSLSLCTVGSASINGVMLPQAEPRCFLPHVSFVTCKVTVKIDNQFMESVGKISNHINTTDT